MTTKPARCLCRHEAHEGTECFWETPGGGLIGQSCDCEQYRPCSHPPEKRGPNNHYGNPYCDQCCTHFPSEWAYADAQRAAKEATIEHTHYGDESYISCPRCDMPVNLFELQGSATCKYCGIEMEVCYDVTSIAMVEYPATDDDKCARCNFERWLHEQDRGVHVAVCEAFIEK